MLLFVLFLLPSLGCRKRGGLKSPPGIPTRRKRSAGRRAGRLGDAAPTTTATAAAATATTTTTTTTTTTATATATTTTTTNNNNNNSHNNSNNNNNNRCIIYM